MNKWNNDPLLLNIKPFKPCTKSQDPRTKIQDKRTKSQEVVGSL